MAASRHVWMVVILCVALLFVGGILLPKLFSKHIFELRTELNAHNKSVILDYDGNIVLNDIKTEDQVGTIHSHDLDHDDVSSVSTLQTPKTAKRYKRQTSNKGGNEYLSWNFNLNISHYKSPASPVLNEDMSHTADYSKNSLDAAIYLAGEGPNQTYNLQKALGSVGIFIRSLFGGGVQNLTYEETDKNNDAYSLNGVLQAGSDTKVIKHSVSVETDEGKGKPQSDRGGRFLFDFLGFGRTPSTKTTQPIESKVTTESPHELSNSSAFSVKNETDFNIRKDIFAFTGSEDIDFDESKNSQTEVPLSKSEHSSELENGRAINDIFDTVTESSAHTFTDEKLEDFCMNLVHQLGESTPFLSVNSSEEDERNKESNLSTPPKLKMVDCLNLVGALEEKPEADLDIIENSFLVSTDATDSNSKSAKDTERGGRVLSWFQFGFGSGRSGLDAPISDEKIDEPTDEPNTDSKEETENEPTIKDCISYFRKNQNVKIFPKPNLMDILSDSNIEITDFANGTISPKLKKQNVQLIINFLETTAINCALKNGGTNAENVQIAHEEKSKFSPEKFSTDVKEPDTGIGETSTRTAVTDLKWENAKVTSEGGGIKHGTEIETDERIFGFGSGNDAVPEIDDFRFINSSNGDEKLEETSATASNDPDSDLEAISNQERFFINLGFGTQGSGEERQLTEDSDIHVESTEHIEDGCENDCFVKSASDKTDDCNDSECFSEPPFEPNFSIEILQNYSSNENDCHNDCFFIPNDSNVTENKGNIFYNNSEFNGGNLTSRNLNAFNESCSCHEHSTETGFIPENADSRECDCSLSIDEIPVKDFTNTEKNPFQIGSENPSSATQSLGNDCNDCDYQPDTGTQNPESDAFKIISTYADPRSFHDTVSANILESSEFQADKDIHHTKAVEIITELSSINEESESSQNFSRFLVPIFLTGSGNGLFGDSEGPINLTEEISNESRPQRRGRLDDSGEIDHCDDCDIDLSNIQQNKDVPEETVKALVTTENSNPDDNILKSRIGPSDGKSNQTQFATEASESSSEILSKSTIDFTGDILTTTEPPLRFCVSASECNSELNERCVTTSNFFSICSCSRAFVRNKITGKCIKKSSFMADLNLPAEKFVEDFGNPESPRYKQMQNDANKMMHGLLNDNPELVPIVIDAAFTGFRRGSLIMSWNIVLASENESEAELVSHLQRNLNRGLLDESLKEKVSFNISNAYIQSVSNSLDPCKSKELNYCHHKSQCIRNRSLPGGYECRCKGDYIDVSFNSEYPGEICEAFCTSDYCGHHGICKWLPETGRHCVCKDWYFGDRCGISGKIVVAGFSANIFVFIVLILVLVFCKARHSRRSYGRTQRHRGSDQFRGHAIAAGRVSDVIAMEENIGTKVAKISHISTPVQNIPVIKVIRPTLNESSLSIYDDSTFDITPTSESGQRNSGRETPSADASVP